MEKLRQNRVSNIDRSVSKEVGKLIGQILAFKVGDPNLVPRSATVPCVKQIYRSTTVS